MTRQGKSQNGMLSKRKWRWLLMPGILLVSTAPTGMSFQTSSPAAVNWISSSSKHTAQHARRYSVDSSTTISSKRRRSTTHLHTVSTSTTTTHDHDKQTKQFDQLLEEGRLREAVRFLQVHPSMDISNERFVRIFRAIERRTAEVDEQRYNGLGQQQQQDIAEFPLLSQPRMEMTDMYKTLSQLDQLRLFGAVDAGVPPAAGSHAVRPSILEEITGLPMQALTPRPNNAFVYLGAAVAISEGLVSLQTGLSLDGLVFMTAGLVVIDRILLNGAVLDSITKAFSPGLQAKIQRHEAGHFLCAYLLGCPVEGCVLDAWAALQDSRFGLGRQVTAGTSFFDVSLSQEINSPQREVTRSSIDRYSIIVMAGIAAEAANYRRADGGAGDEMALIAFLSQLNGKTKATAVSLGDLGVSGKNSNTKIQVPTWNNMTIRNQARWGALQAVLMLRQYKPCFDALVEELDRGGSLGECIYAIEQAGRENSLGPLTEPLGYILELPNDVEKWTTEKPKTLMSPESEKKDIAAVATEPIKAEASLEALRGFRSTLEQKLKQLDEELGDAED